MTKRLFTGLTVALLILIGCGSNNSSTPTTTPTSSTTVLTCTATGTVTTGNISVANTTVDITNLNVQIANGAAGPFTISIGSLPPQTSPSPNFIFPGVAPLTTGASGGISDTVTVSDASTGYSGTCTLTIASTATGTTSGQVQVSLSSATASPGTGITVTPSAPSLNSPNFYITVMTPSPYVNIINQNTDIVVVDYAPETIVLNVEAVDSVTQAAYVTTVSLSFTGSPITVY